VHEKANYYRDLAERCRKLAEDIPDAEAKALMLDVARQYDNPLPGEAAFYSDTVPCLSAKGGET
jgi:hypothetical protein